MGDEKITWLVVLLQFLFKERLETHLSVLFNKLQKLVLYLEAHLVTEPGIVWSAAGSNVDDVNDMAPCRSMAACKSFAASEFFAPCRFLARAGGAGFSAFLALWNPTLPGAGGNGKRRILAGRTRP